MAHKDIAQMGILPLELCSLVQNTISNGNVKPTFNHIYGNSKLAIKVIFILLIITYVCRNRIHEKILLIVFISILPSEILSIY